MDLADLVLTTARLHIRPWRRADLDLMASWPPFTAPLDQIWNWPRRLKHDGTLALFFSSRAADPARAAWTLVAQTGRQAGGVQEAPSDVAGLLQLMSIRREEGSAALGIAFGAPWVGQGYGREALEAFLDAYFGLLRFTTIRLEVGLANARARRLYAALGFRETKRFWHDAGSAEEYRFLDAPAYAGVRRYFRWANGGVYQLCMEMELTKDERTHR